MAEAVCYIAEGRPVAVAMEMIGEESQIDGRLLSAAERDDLNRGRIFLRNVASKYGVPVFGNVRGAAQHAIQLCATRKPGITMLEIANALDRIRCEDYRFITTPIHGGIILQIEGVVEDIETHKPTWHRGRKWYLDSQTSIDDVIRTAFKAIATWQEHELREHFLVDGKSIFSPHSSILESVDRSD